MRKFFYAVTAYALLLAIIFAVTSPAPAQQPARNCISVHEFVEMIEKARHRHIVVQGDAMQPWLDIRTKLGVGATNASTDAVVVVFLPAIESGFVAFITGEEACDPIRVPEAIVDSILRPA